MKRTRNLDTPEIPIAPMIDCVFLMLVYFMTTSSLERSEADLPCPVNTPGMAAEPLPAIDEQVLSLDGAGDVLWNGSRFRTLSDEQELLALGERLASFRQTCDMAGSDSSLRIEPDKMTPHQAIVTLLDAVADSGIETVHLP